MNRRVNLQEPTGAPYTLLICPTCGKQVNGTVRPHMGPGGGLCERVNGPAAEVEVVPLAVAENLAAALDDIEGLPEDPVKVERRAREALAEYRALVPAKTTEETG